MRRIILLTALLAAIGVSIAESSAEPKISSQHVSKTVHMLSGAGGNIGVSVGDEGILIIDDKYAPLAEEIANAIGHLGKTPMRYVINTHYHGDHTGSNSWFREIKDTTIFAHENVRKRLASVDGHKHSSLPVVTYESGITFHFNDDTIKVEHLPSGHTDSDSVVWFEKADVLHAGDLFFEGRFPYIDLGGGGTVAGYIKNVQILINKLGDNTKVISGHGDLSDKAGFQQALDMIKQTAAFVASHKASGKSEEAIIKDGLDDKWKSWSWQFINEEKWIKTLYKGQ
jgi:glyoxylase-like metal-dependent hydrolase (beta-lactamase superfamily II)